MSHAYTNGTSALQYPASDLVNETGLKVSKQETDSMGRPLPSIGEIYETWLPLSEVVKITRFETTQGVIHAIKRGAIAGYKTGPKYRGEWRVDPSTITEWLTEKDE